MTRPIDWLSIYNIFKMADGRLGHNHHSRVHTEDTRMYRRVGERENELIYLSGKGNCIAAENCAL